MGRGVGKALESALKDEGELETKKGAGKHIFLNPHRRDIFSTLTLTPCIGIGQLAEKTGIVQNTVEWHLVVLIKERYVSEYREGRKKTYFPQGLLTQEGAEFFFVLNHPKFSDVLFKVIEGEGLSQSEISKTSGVSRQTVAGTLARLEEIGLVTRVSDGANTRYFATTLLPEKAEDFYQHSREYSEFIINKLAQEGGKNPELVKRGLDRIFIELGFRSKGFTIEVGINPYLTCISC